jgi:hypothetical protein
MRSILTSTKLWLHAASLIIAASAARPAPAAPAAAEEPHHAHAVVFSLRSVRDGRWSEPGTWEPARTPTAGDRVLVSRGTRVVYDVASSEVIRLLQVAGALSFDPERDTLLEAGVIKVQPSEHCSERGFACDFEGTSAAGEPNLALAGAPALLEIGTREHPVPRGRTARVRLHFLEGMDKNDAPALVCCSGRMEIHGAPMSHTWVKLGAESKPGDAAVVLSEVVSGWEAGDEVIVTGSLHRGSSRTFRPGARGAQEPETELRRIERIDGATVHLDRPLEKVHFGSGDLRSEVANLSRSVVIESADPGGVRGHTLYHRFSAGSISYARFAHLGKEGVLGRYPIHFHIAGDSMRGASVLGAAVVDSHNRWITIHGTRYLVIRDCVGYRSVGHGFFLEDGTELHNLLERNLGVHAYRGRRLPGQVLPFDPNDGAAYWWANGRNAFVRNVSCENDEYGFRYDSQKTSDFDSRLAIAGPDGSNERVDIRTLPIGLFQDNEAHTEGLYGVVIAGNNQAGSPLGGPEALERVDRTAPDLRHPHVIRGLRIWQVHYGLRPQVPSMRIEDVSISHAAYGIYRPAFENQEYRKIRIAFTSTEPFNRGMDDASTQHGKITVDGLTFEGFTHSSMPLIQMSDNNPSRAAESHFRRIEVVDRRDRGRRPLVGRGGGAVVEPVTATSVPVFLHDHFGPGRHAKVIVQRDCGGEPQGAAYRTIAPVTGEDAVAAEVAGVEFPKLLDPVDDLPPATVVLSVRPDGGALVVEGVSHDNGAVAAVVVNGKESRFDSGAGAAGGAVVDWKIRIALPPDGKVAAHAVDASGNVERSAHVVAVKAPALAPRSRRF